MTRTNSRQARGYGTAHVNERKRWAPIVARGEACCSRCGRPIAPGALWDLDHTPDRTAYLGPSHQHCNRRAGGKRRAQLALKRGVSRSW